MAELPTFFKTEVYRSRIARRCEECGGEIAAGEKYQRDHGVWDGQWSTFVLCLNCNALRDAVLAAEDDPTFVVPYGELIMLVAELRSDRERVAECGSCGWTGDPNFLRQKHESANRCPLCFAHTLRPVNRPALGAAEQDGE